MDKSQILITKDENLTVPTIQAPESGATRITAGSTRNYLGRVNALEDIPPPAPWIMWFSNKEQISLP
ncbi:hypothetical protein ACLOJK_003054 [Asimina triloba]